MRTLYRSIYLIILFSSILLGISPDFNRFHASFQNQNLFISCSPKVNIGTHRNSVGINANAQAWLALWKLPLAIGFEADVNSSANLTYFGLPGASGILETGGTLMLGWGRNSEFGESKYLRVNPYRHSFAKRYTYYFATDGTSQPFAQYIYTFNISNKMIILNFGNDAYAALRDGFRSAAGEVELYVNMSDYLLAFSFGYKIWHGDYSEQIYTNPGPYYDFTTIIGGEHTLGLLFARFRYNALGISIGYDSDKIRVMLQNAVHSAMGINLVPDVDRADRIFIELSLFSNSGLY